MRTLKTLDLAEAERAIAAGRTAAAALAAPMAFAVVDHAGELIACARLDGAPARNLRHAIRKARTAAIMGRDTATFARDIRERGGGLDQWGDPGLTTLAGGFAATRDGFVVGGLACGGAPTEVDEQVGRAMIAALWPQP